MSKVTMLNPVGYAHRDILRRQSPIERLHSTPKYGIESIALVTTDQAEAYKDACAREALEEAANNAVTHFKAVQVEHEKTKSPYYEGAMDAYDLIEQAIRALIPK